MTFCKGVGYGRVSWNGANWKVDASWNPDYGSPQLQGVSCVTATLCKAVGYIAWTGPALAVPAEWYIESWNGTTWSADDPGPNTGTDGLPVWGTLADVSCPTATLCKAVGREEHYVFRSVTGGAIRSWNGTSWSRDGSDTVRMTLSGVACAAATLSATFCKAVGGSGTIHSWNGAAWLPDVSGTTASLLGVSCPAVTLCKAVGAGGTILSWNGAAWLPEASGTTNTLLGVSCPSPTFCKAVGFAGTILSWNGTSWRADSSGTTSRLNGVSCATTTFCKAVGVDAGETAGTVRSWNGTSWSADSPSGARR